jgi:DNA (cytosine-5)-methyltransferase 1
VNELALFAGSGGGILGGHLLGWRTVCAVEWEPYPACVLAARQNDGILPAFPIWDDVQTFDGRPWRGIVDVVSGGFPCQDISAAGKGAGIDGDRSGMWSHMARIVGEVRPRHVFVENSPMLTSRGLHRVLGDLASLGFDARWGVVSAADVGAPHQRDRIWIVANSTQLQRDGGDDNSRVCVGREPVSQFGNCGRAQTLADTKSTRTSKNNQGLWSGFEGISGGETTNREMADSDSTQRERGCVSLGIYSEHANSDGTSQLADSSDIGSRSSPTDRELEGNQRPTVSSLDCEWWDREPGQTSREIESGLGRVADGVAARVDRLKAIGNGQVPLVAATAWSLLK